MTDARKPESGAPSEDGLPKLPAVPTAGSTPAAAPSTPTDYLVGDRRLKAHSATETFPLLPRLELEEMADDIKAHGQQEPVVLDAAAALLVDGRNRCLACEIAGVPVASRTLRKGEDLVSFVASKNLHRRNLKTAQRAIIAAKLANLRKGGDSGRPPAAQPELSELQSGLDDRRGNAGETGGLPENVVRGKGLPVGGVHPAAPGRAPGKKRRTPRKSEEGTNSQSEPLVSQARAAELLGVSTSTLKKAKAVMDDPILAPALKEGKLSVNAAYKNRNADEHTKTKLIDGELTAARLAVVEGGDWTTPDWLLPIVRQLLDDKIDLDPASSKKAQKVVRALKIITPEEDALKPETSWAGTENGVTVWLNPPTETFTIGKFADRLLAELETGAVGRALWLGPARVEAHWCQKLLRRARAFVGLARPVREGRNYMPYILICFRIDPERVHAVIGDQGFVSTVFRPAGSPSAPAPRTSAERPVSKARD